MSQIRHLITAIFQAGMTLETGQRGGFCVFFQAEVDCSAFWLKSYEGTVNECIRLKMFFSRAAGLFNSRALFDTVLPDRFNLRRKRDVL